MNMKLIPAAMLALSLCAFIPACGGSDDDDDGHQTADAGTGAGCGNVTEDGICQGDVAKYCNTVRNVINSYDCRAQESKTCGIVSGIATCVADGTDAGTPSGGDCGNVTKYGRCDGNTLVYCSDKGKLVEEDCFNRTCKLVNTTEGYDCVDDEGGGGGGTENDVKVSDTCEKNGQTIDDDGTCIGGDYYYCSIYNDTLMKRACGSRGCSMDNGNYGCIE